MTTKALTEHEADLLRESVVAEWQDAAQQVCRELEESPQTAVQLGDAAGHTRHMVELVELLESHIGFGEEG